MCACSQPVAVVRNSELEYESEWADDVTTLIKNNLKDAAGMPVSVQVVGMPFQEERVLGLSRRIEQHFKFYKDHPLPEVELNKVN